MFLIFLKIDVVWLRLHYRPGMLEKIGHPFSFKSAGVSRKDRPGMLN